MFKLFKKKPPIIHALIKVKFHVDTVDGDRYTTVEYKWVDSDVVYNVETYLLKSIRDDKYVEVMHNKEIVVIPWHQIKALTPFIFDTTKIDYRYSPYYQRFYTDKEAEELAVKEPDATDKDV